MTSIAEQTIEMKPIIENGKKIFALDKVAEYNKMMILKQIDEAMKKVAEEYWIYDNAIIIQTKKTKEGWEYKR
jgi:hypothetical protein